MLSIHLYTYAFHNIHISVNRIYVTLTPSACSKVLTREQITIQLEQYGGTVHLFIGMGRNPGKSTFMTLTLIHNCNINH
jgi:hypothetical protein